MKQNSKIEVNYNYQKLFQVNIDNDDFMDIEKNEIIKKLNNYQKNFRMVIMAINL